MGIEGRVVPGADQPPGTKHAFSQISAGVRALGIKRAVVVTAAHHKDLAFAVLEGFHGAVSDGVGGKAESGHGGLRADKYQLCAFNAERCVKIAPKARVAAWPHRTGTRERQTYSTRQ